MAIPDLLTLPSEADYKQYFVDNYCAQSPIFTWDGLPVMFYPEMFEHAFYKRAAKEWHAPKSAVDWDRCKRMPWIKDVLADNSIVPRQGYDKATGKNDNSRRVVLVSQEKYVVVIRQDKQRWRFVTAYLVDNSDTYNKLMAAPLWTCSATTSA